MMVIASPAHALAFQPARVTAVRLIRFVWPVVAERSYLLGPARAPVDQPWAGSSMRVLGLGRDRLFC